jgi:hypothetical protein
MFFCPIVYVEPMPLALSDSQLEALMLSAGDVEQEKRHLFLQRVDAMLALKGRRFTDRDLIEVLTLAQVGLVRRSPTAKAESLREGIQADPTPPKISPVIGQGRPPGALFCRLLP